MSTEREKGSRKPPRVKRKLSAVARAELGAERECVECGDVKEVSETTFTPHSKGLRGWKTTCKVCDALNASTARHAEKAVEKRRTTIENRSDLEELVDEMYIQALSHRRDQKVLDHCITQLGDHIRCLYEAGRPLDSLLAFVEVVKPLVAGWKEPGAIHGDIMGGLVSTHRRRLIIATRYSAKSTLTSIYVAWRIFLDPLIKVLVISRGSKLAARMLRTVRHVFIAQCPLLAHLLPTDDCLDNAEQFMVPQSLQVTTGGATLTSVGVTSNLPGLRADLTIGDDVEGTQEDTPEKVMALREILNELHMINPAGEKIMLGTYQSEFSLYAQLADEDDEEGTKIWELHRACMFEEDVVDGKTFYTSRWPEMFSDKQAMDWRRAVTERAWRLHAMLVADPSILNEKPLKIKDFVLVDWGPEVANFPTRCTSGGTEVPGLSRWGAPKGDLWLGPGHWDVSETAPYVQTILAVDPASGLAGRDAIGVAVLSITQTGMGVIRHLEGVRGPDKLQNLARVAAIAKYFSVTNLVVEELADGLYGSTLENQLMMVGFPMQVTPITTGGMNKGRRIIETLAPVMGNGRLVMLKKVAHSDHCGEMVQQLVRISWDGRTGNRKDHDDIVDALAHAVKEARGSLVSDLADNIGEIRSAKLDEWRGIDLRFGGLGSSNDRPGRRRQITVDGLGTDDVDDLPLAERLLEEDEVLTRYEARKEALQMALMRHVRAGVDVRVQQDLRKRIAQTDETIRDLKSLHIL